MRLAADQIHYQTMGQEFCQIYDGDQYHRETIELEGVGDESFNGLRNAQWIYPEEILCVMRLVFLRYKEQSILPVSKSSKEKLIPELMSKLKKLAALGKHCPKDVPPYPAAYIIVIA